MSIGLALTKEQIDTTIGDIARSFFYQFRRAENFKYFLDGKSDVELIALGYTDSPNGGDIANIRSAAVKLDEIRQIWQGLINAPQEDYRAFPRRVAGMGDV